MKSFTSVKLNLENQLNKPVFGLDLKEVIV